MSLNHAPYRPTPVKAETGSNIISLETYNRYFDNLKPRSRNFLKPLIDKYRSDEVLRTQFYKCLEQCRNEDNHEALIHTLLFTPLGLKAQDRLIALIAAQKCSIKLLQFFTNQASSPADYSNILDTVEQYPYTAEALSVWNITSNESDNAQIFAETITMLVKIMGEYGEEGIQTVVIIGKTLNERADSINTFARIDSTLDIRTNFFTLKGIINFLNRHKNLVATKLYGYTCSGKDSDDIPLEQAITKLDLTTDTEPDIIAAISSYAHSAALWRHDTTEKYGLDATDVEMIATIRTLSQDEKECIALIQGLNNSVGAHVQDSDIQDHAKTRHYQFIRQVISQGSTRPIPQAIQELLTCIAIFQGTHHECDDEYLSTAWPLIEQNHSTVAITLAKIWQPDSNWAKAQRISLQAIEEADKNAAKSINKYLTAYLYPHSPALHLIYKTAPQLGASGIELLWRLLPQKPPVSLKDVADIEKKLFGTDIPIATRTTQVDKIIQAIELGITFDLEKKCIVASTREDIDNERSYNRLILSCSNAEITRYLAMADQGDLALIQAITKHPTYSSKKGTLLSNICNPFALTESKRKWGIPADLLIRRLHGLKSHEQETAITTIFQPEVLSELNELEQPESFSFFLDCAATEVPEFLLFVVAFYHKKYQVEITTSPTSLTQALRTNIKKIFSKENPEQKKITMMKKIAADLKQHLAQANIPPEQQGMEIAHMLTSMIPANEQGTHKKVA